MSQSPDLRTTRMAYDTVAVEYAERFSTGLETQPLDRALLAAFAELVQNNGAGTVADLGCGPGHVTAHLQSLGLTAFGVDISPAMVALARQKQPGLRFEEGSMAALNLADGVLGGILARYSIIHTPPELLPTVFAEFHRVLAPGGHLLVAFLAGDDPLHLAQPFDHKVSLAYRWTPHRVAELLRQAGLVEVARLVREPDETERFQQACLLAHKPELRHSTATGPGSQPPTLATSQPPPRHTSTAASPAVPSDGQEQSARDPRDGRHHPQ